MHDIDTYPTDGSLNLLKLLAENGKEMILIYIYIGMLSETIINW